MADPGDPKATILHALGQHFNIERLAGQSLFRVNSQAIAYVRFSKDLGGGNFYFGVGEKDFRHFLSDNLHVLFVCGDIGEVLVLPADILMTLVSSVPVSHGQWKLNVLRRDERFLLQVPGAGKFDVTEFRNHFDFTPASCRGPVWPRILEHLPLSKPKRAAERTAIVEHAAPAPADLGPRLKTTVRASANPKAFEEVLTEVFTALGFMCRRIGGSAETDVLVEAPSRIVVDGKSTMAPSLSHVNFTRIKQHKAAHNAVAMLVVSAGFQPAVVRDALLEEASLITVDTLNDILAMHARLPLSPIVLGQVLTTKGLIDRHALQPLQEGFTRVQRWLRQVFLIIENEDFEWRPLHEVKGRLNLVCEQLGQEKFALEDLTKMLDLLSDPPFDVLEKRNGEYRSIYYPEQAKSKVLAVFNQEGAHIATAQRN